MTIEKKDIEKKIIKVMQEACKAEIVINQATVIAEELGIDSVAIMEAIMELEDFYQIDIPMNDLADVHTIGDLLNYLEKRVAT